MTTTSPQSLLTWLYARDAEVNIKVEQYNPSAETTSSSTKSNGDLQAIARGSPILVKP